MSKILRHAGLLASAAFVLTAGGSALAGEPGKKEGEAKVERKVIVMKDGEQVVVSGSDVGRPMPMRMHMDPAARADHMRTILQLRPEQEPAFQAFLAATKPETHKFEMKLDKDGKPPEHKMLTTPERLDLQAKRMAEHQAAFQKRAAATRAFYSQLSPSQQKVFDTLHARHGGGRHMKIIRRGGPGGHGGPGGDHRIIMRGGPEGGPPMPGGMAWSDEDGEDFALLEGGDMDVQVFIDGEEIDGGDED
jgi:periplasmic protein CpxP/Spy